MTKEIKTPKGQIVQIRGKNNIMRAKLTFNPGFGATYTGNYTRAQKYVDSEVLRQSDPYVPMKTGMLKKSGTLGTDIGSGLVQYIAPYARSQYYRKGKVGSQTGPLRGPQWFERMKAVCKKAIMQGAKKIAGGGK